MVIAAAVAADVVGNVAAAADDDVNCGGVEVVE